MKLAVFTFVLAIAVVSQACSTHAHSSPTVSNGAGAGASSDSTIESRQTLLLVSLEDGSVIKQTITSSADICFKNNSDSATTCLTQGAPIFSPDTDTVIGFEMIEDRIDLIAKTE